MTKKEIIEEILRPIVEDGLRLSELLNVIADRRKRKSDRRAAIGEKQRIEARFRDLKRELEG